MYKLDELPIRRRSWMKIAAIPKARQGWLIEDCSDLFPNDIQRVFRWVEKVKEGRVIRSVGDPLCGKGLLFYGTPGQGKTTLALSVIQQLVKDMPLKAFDVKPDRTLIAPCYFATYNNILDLKGSLMSADKTDEDSQRFDGILGEAEDDAYNVRVLIIDDVGKEHLSGSGWQQSLLHHIIRTRFNNGLPTIVTTNIELNNWAATYGPAMESFAREAFAYIVLESTKGDLRR
jgi:DNA replication protein DnaC